MNPKKCPKCGESNPPEAVMCWACYTPLSGAAGGATASTPARAAAQAGEKEKTPIPTWMIGAGVVVLLAVLGVGAKLMFFNDAPIDSGPPITGGTKSRITVPPVPNDPGPVGVPAPAIVSPNPTTPLPPAAQPGTYTVVAAPNPKYNVGTMAIVPSPPITDARQAAALAVYAREQMMRNKNWQILHIYVFADRQTGLAFRNYQSGRNGALLAPTDYRALTNLWPNTLVRYEFNQGIEAVSFPSMSPNGWWGNAVNGKKVTN